LILLEGLDSIVESRYDIEEEDKKLDLWPVVCPQFSESEVVIVNLESKPWPFHGPCISFVLMEIFKGLCLLRCDYIKLWLRI
jgi:hypothetical protein